MWTFYLEKIVFSNSLVGGAFVSVLVLSGAAAYLIPAIRREGNTE
jgi:hypothetical protein